MKFTLENFREQKQSIKLAGSENRDFLSGLLRNVWWKKCGATATPSPAIHQLISRRRKKKLVRFPPRPPATHESITIHFLEYDLFYIYDVAGAFLFSLCVGFQHNFIASEQAKGSAQLIINLNCFGCINMSRMSHKFESKIHLSDYFQMPEDSRVRLRWNLSGFVELRLRRGCTSLGCSLFLDYRESLGCFRGGKSSKQIHKNPENRKNEKIIMFELSPKEIIYTVIRGLLLN